MTIVELEDIARRVNLEDQAAELISACKVRMLLPRTPDTVFFSHLALRLKYAPNWSVQTACVNGKLLAYNPAFIAGLTKAELTGVLAHEVMHCALKHFARLGGRNPSRANVAMDLAINGILREAKMTLPSGALFPEQYNLPPDRSFEWYYDHLPDDAGGDGDDPGGCGGVSSTGDSAMDAAADAEWQVATINAAECAKKATGTVSGGLDRFFDKHLAPAPHWTDVLREFLVRSVEHKSDFTWLPCNRRFVYMGLYLPGVVGETLGEIVIHVDTSDSIGGPALAKFAAEIQGVLENKPLRCHIVYCDCAVKKVDTWTPEDGDLELRPRGGGGTSHCPVWEWVREAEIEPLCLISLTDGYTNFGEAPPYPVLFAMPERSNYSVPFGRLVHI